MYPHRIRLRGPWQCQPLVRVSRLPDGRVANDYSNLPPTARVTVPGPWQEGELAGFTGRVRFLRRFGYPGRIDDNERVWVTVEKVLGASTISLNGLLLAEQPGSFDYREIDVTSLLQRRNELAIEVEDLDGTGGLKGEVALEVRRQAFLQSVSVSQSSPGRLFVTGEVVGDWAGPLEVYVVWGRRNAGYSLVQSSAEGTRFQIEAEISPSQQDPRELSDAVPDAVRVELIQGATVWYSVDKKLPAEPSSGSE
ncbi:MAG: hypothetical protein ACJ8FY_20345 [Gemmataceae bacterium]